MLGSGPTGSQWDFPQATLLLLVGHGQVAKRRIRSDARLPNAIARDFGEGPAYGDSQSIHTPVSVPETCVVEVNQLNRRWHALTPPFWLDPQRLHSALSASDDD